MVAAVGAAIVVVRGDDEGRAGDYALLHQARRGSTTFVLSRPNGDEIRRLSVPVAEDGDPPRIFPAGRGHVLVATDTATLLVPLDGREPTEVADQPLIPASNWLTDRHEAVQGIILGEPPGGSVLVDLAAGETRELGDLIDDDGPYFVTSYTDDGRHALVDGSEDSWLVPLTGEGTARALNGRAGQRALNDDRLVAVRGRGDSEYDVVLMSVADESEEAVLWSGGGPVVTTWSGERVAVVGADHVTVLDPRNGDTSRVLSGRDLDVTSVLQTFGHLVGSDEDERRWYRFDDEGGEVAELRGLESLPVNPGGRRVVFAEAGDRARVVAWNPDTGSTATLDGTAAQLEILAQGVRNNVMSSSRGRFVTGGFGPVLLGDFDTGKIVELDDDVSFAGGFSPDDRHMLVARVEQSGVALGVWDPTDPGVEVVDLGDERGATTWAFP